MYFTFKVECCRPTAYLAGQPYQDSPAWHLVEILERQLDQGEPFNEGIVIELGKPGLGS